MRAYTPIASGDASLVPPTPHGDVHEPLINCSGCVVYTRYAPEFASAAIAMSGTPRRLPAATIPVVSCTGCCQLVAFSNWLKPPPPEFHAASPRYVSSLFERTVVPPTATIHG